MTNHAMKGIDRDLTEDDLVMWVTPHHRVNEWLRYNYLTPLIHRLKIVDGWVDVICGEPDGEETRVTGCFGEWAVVRPDVDEDITEWL